MPVEFTASTPIEVYTITAADYLVAVGLAFLLALLAAGFGAWVFSQGGEATPPDRAEVDSREGAETTDLAELPRRSGLRTGTIHAPQYRRSDDDTVVIEQAGSNR